ncbi:MAG: hypothetical protein ACYC5H_03160 [Methylovirgula sp.]
MDQNVVRISPPIEDPSARDERHLELLIERLPTPLRRSIRWLRRPSSRWVRIPAGGLFIVGGVFSFLPILGLWMLPLGLTLLAEDAPMLRRRRGRILEWIAEHRPHWFGSEQNAITHEPQRLLQDEAAAPKEK